MKVKPFHEVARDMLECVKVIHKHEIIHRDIKPDNFRVKNDKVYIIDFGTFITYERLIDSKTPQFIGSAKFASIDVLRLNPCAFYDDLESLGYSLLSLID